MGAYVGKSPNIVLEALNTISYAMPIMTNSYSLALAQNSKTHTQSETCSKTFKKTQ